MPFKDGDNIPALWNYDTTRQAIVLSQRELKELRDQLNQEYLRRWSGYISGVHQNSLYMDYRSASTQFTDSDGKHIHRLPSWNGSLAAPTASTSNNSQYQMADGNVDGTYWNQYTKRDFRGCPVWYSPLDRYIDGTVTYNRTSNTAPTVTSSYVGPTPGQTFPLGTSEWRNAGSYKPHGDASVTKDRAFKHLIDGLANIVDIDKYFGHGIISGDKTVPNNPVNYGADQNPKNSERVEHHLRQTGVTRAATPTTGVGNTVSLTGKNGSIKDWIAILKAEQRNEYYLRACNYHHWIWYFEWESYYSRWTSSGGSASWSSPGEGSWGTPHASGPSSPSYSRTAQVSTPVRKNYNPAYYGHREAYTSCLQACTGFCSQTCFHVCDEQCVYLCDDACGYTCMNGTYQACGTVCICNCTDNCGGPHQDGSRHSNDNACQHSCTGGSRYSPSGCSQCAGSCSGYAKDQQACSSGCVGFCSPGCDSICTGSCLVNCQGSCEPSCTGDCNESSGTSKDSCCKGNGEASAGDAEECEDEEEEVVGGAGGDDWDDDW